MCQLLTAQLTFRASNFTELSNERIIFFSVNHLNNLGGLDGGAVEDPGWVQPEPCGDPGDCEAGEDDVAHLLVLGVDAHFCAL